MKTSRFESICSNIRNQSIVVDGKRYSCSYSTSNEHGIKNGEYKKCKHANGLNIIDSIDDGPEMVAVIEVCDHCGLILPPIRIHKGDSKKPLALGKARSDFEKLTRLLKKTAQPC